eukprot:356114-Chlamydomonas_euryale.AAC.12
MRGEVRLSWAKRAGNVCAAMRSCRTSSGLTSRCGLQRPRMALPSSTLGALRGPGMRSVIVASTNKAGETLSA